MTATTPAISPLRQRMIDDMRLRKLADKTQSHYLRAVRQFSLFLGHSPDRATIEDLRRYQLHLVDQGISAISLNAAIIGLKFFFAVTLDHPLPGLRHRITGRQYKPTPPDFDLAEVDKRIRLGRKSSSEPPSAPQE